LLGLRLLDTDSLRVVYAAQRTGVGVIVFAGEENLESLIGDVAAEANHETDRRQPVGPLLPRMTAKGPVTAATWRDRNLRFHVYDRVAPIRSVDALVAGS
jgi:hypothetical protein